MLSEINIDNLDAGDTGQINMIANWYFEEWCTPIERTITRLENQPNADLLFQLVATKGNRLIATAGLANKVNLTGVHERFNNLKPWVALLYTERGHRKRGVGKLLLEKIEQKAREMGLTVIYLYTFTAEWLYTKCGWQEIARVDYKGHDTVIMKKALGTTYHET